jgi:hypothetical protein
MLAAHNLTLAREEPRSLLRAIPTGSPPQGRKQSTLRGIAPVANAICKVVFAVLIRVSDRYGQPCGKPRHLFRYQGVEAWTYLGRRDSVYQVRPIWVPDRVGNNSFSTVVVSIGRLAYKKNPPGEVP